MPDLRQYNILNIDLMKVMQDLLIALIILIVGLQIIRVLRKIICKIIDSKNLSPGFKYTIDQIVKFFLHFLLVVMILQTMGLQTSALLAVLGSIGLALGLSLQGSLSDIASGILIIVLEPIRHGEFVYLDNKKEELLEVVEIRLFHTIFLNGNNLTVIIPNSMLVNDRITNVSRHGFAYTGITVSIAFEEDVERVRKIIEEVFKANEMLIHTQEYRISVMDMSDGRITLNCQAAVLPENYGAVRGDLREAVKNALDVSNIKVSSPAMGIVIANK